MTVWQQPRRHQPEQRLADLRRNPHGVGAEWKINSSLSLTVEGGYAPWRQFDFHRTEVRYHNETGAPYGGASCSTGRSKVAPSLLSCHPEVAAATEGPRNARAGPFA